MAACIVGFLLLCALQNARKVRQKCDKSHKTASSATVCAPVLYALPYIIRLYNELSLPLLWAGCVAFHAPPTYSPTYGGAVSNTDPIHKGMNQIHNPDTKTYQHRHKRQGGQSD